TPGSEGPQEAGNADLIAELTGCRAMGTLETLTSAAAADPDQLADALAASIPAAALRSLLELGPGSGRSS
ncbi:MAG TPA: hypothetical protein VGP64_12750, partial [Polyangia bacterium]